MRRVLLLSAAVLAMTTEQASAHAMLMHASPGAGTMVQASPKAVVLDYSEGLEPALSGVRVTDQAGHDVTAAPSKANGTEMTVALKPLAPGTYTVSWHALSVDTHKTAGSFRFMVMP